MRRLHHLGFETVGKIDCSGKCPRFELNGHKLANERGIVYAWIAKRGRKSTLLYVGKTTPDGTLKSRCKSHQGGFGHSSTGKGHADRLRALVRDSTVEVWAKKAATTTVFDLPNISLCDAEEYALIQLLDPPWNKSGKKKT